jgi:hypothetical protein
MGRLKMPWEFHAAPEDGVLGSRVSRVKSSLTRTEDAAEEAIPARTGLPL